MHSLRKNRALALIACFLIVVASLEVYSFVKLEKDKDKVEKQNKDKKNKDKGTPVLWRNPGDMRKRDLYYGSGIEGFGANAAIQVCKRGQEWEVA